MGVHIYNLSTAEAEVGGFGELKANLGYMQDLWTILVD